MIQGLIVAGVLGRCRGAVELGVPAQPDRVEEEMVAFVGIKEGKTINRGEVLRDDDWCRCRIPARWVGNLKDFAVPYAAKQTVVGQPVWRTMTGECLLLGEDLKTPPQELKLDEGESVMWIPVDTRAFVPSLVVPGDMVSFLVAAAGGAHAGDPQRRGEADPADDNASSVQPRRNHRTVQDSRLGQPAGQPGGDAGGQGAPTPGERAGDPRQQPRGRRAGERPTNSGASCRPPTSGRWESSCTTENE